MIPTDHDNDSTDEADKPTTIRDKANATLNDWTEAIKDNVKDDYDDIEQVAWQVHEITEQITTVALVD